MSGNPAFIPAELKAIPQWVAWRTERRPSGVTKVPYQVGGVKAESDNPATWTTFEGAARARAEGFDGVGFVFSPDDPFCGIDFDGCLVDGELAEWARPWLDRLAGSYMEISPSGKGVKVWCRGRMPDGKGKNLKLPGEHLGVEAYSQGRFFTVTGDVFGDIPASIANHQEAIDALVAWVKTKRDEANRARREAREPARKASPKPFTATASNGEWTAEDRAVAYLATIEGAVSGQGGHDATFRAACKVVEFGITDVDRVHQILRDHYNPRCKPPWEDHELRHKAEGAIERAEAGKKLREDKPRTAPRAAKAAADPPPTPAFEGPPRPIEAALAPVPKLDPAMIPEPFRAWLLDVADRASLAVEYPAVAAIVAVGGVVGRRMVIKPKRFDGWLVAPNVWGAAVGKPGVMKTHAAEEGLKPLHRLAAEARERHEATIKAHNATLMVLDAQMDAKKAELKKQAKTGTPAVILERTAAEIAAMSEAQEPPKAKRYIVNDATVEKLGELLAENPNGLTVFRDELIGFLRSMDKQGHENDRQFYLEAWNGLSHGYTYDRIGRGTVFIPNVTLSLFGGIQPGPLARYIRGASGGDEADGLVQRFQLMVYPDTPEFNGVDRYPDSVAKGRAFDVFQALDRLDPIALGLPLNDDKGVHYVSFDDEAQEFFNGWYADLEGRCRSGSEDGRFLAHLSKYRSLMPSLALIFHAIENHAATALGPVPLRTAAMAAAWCDFLEAHARRIYQAALDGDPEAAVNLANRIRQSLPNPFTCRQVAQKGWSGLGSVEEARRAVDILEDRGWVRIVEVPPGPLGGRASEQVWINPDLLAMAVKEAG